MDDLPPPPDAERRLAAQTRTGGLVTLGAVVVGVALAVLAHPLALVGAVVAGLVAVAAAVGAWRSRAARRGLGRGCRTVVAVGWTRTPDGTNYALFPPAADPETAAPTAVVRTVRTTRTRSGRAVVCGSTDPDPLGGVALFDLGGGLLGVGRVRSPASAARVWQHRHQPSPWWWRGTDDDPPPV